MQRAEQPAGYVASRSSRIFGTLASALACVLIVGAFFLDIDQPRERRGVRGHSLALIEVPPLTSPRRLPPAQRQPVATMPRQIVRTDLHRPDPIATVAGPAQLVPGPAVPSAAAAPASATNETASTPAPPTASPASGPPQRDWEDDVLARLHAFRRYPFSSRRRREEGQPVIRFVIDRGGHVLSSRLEHSSNYPALDREAVSLPLRAQPLPPPPESRAGDTIELVVPVEFILDQLQ